jgi:hypothetical protein
MTIKNHPDRPGIHVVDDAHELNSIAGGAGNSTTGDAELDGYLENKWIQRSGYVLLGLYLYGNPTHRARVQGACTQLGNGVNNAGRDSLNLIYIGVSKVAGLASWIKSYFVAAARSVSSRVAEYCPRLPAPTT